MTLKLARYLPNLDAIGYPNVDYRNDLPVELHERRVLLKDELQAVEFYATSSIDPGTGEVLLSDLVVRESYAYVRDSAGFVQTETKTVGYYNESNVVAVSSVFQRQYDNAARFLERRMSRVANLDELQATVLQAIIDTESTTQENALNLMNTLTETHLDAVTAYVYTASGSLGAAIGTDLTAWLDNDTGGGLTIRDIIVTAVT